jgi:hypothetical protein
VDFNFNIEGLWTLFFFINKNKVKRISKMTLSFSKLNEIAYLYENAVHGEQEVLGEDASDAGVSARKTIGKAAGSYFNTMKGVAKGYADVAGSQLKGLAGQTTTSNNPLARAGNAVTRTISAPSRAGLSFAKGLVTGQGSDKPASSPSSTDYKSKFAGKRDAAFNKAKGIKGSPVVGPKPSAAGTTPPAGAGARPPGGNGPKLLPAKPAAPAKPAIPTGTTAGGTTFQRRAATGDELRAAQDARAAAKAAGNTKGAEEAAVKAGVNASKPATPSLSQRAAAMPAMGSSQFKPATTSQATNAAGSNSAAASGSLVPASNKIASSLKPIDLKASYEYDAYDLVLEYLLSQGHAETVAEAQYLMTEMDAEMIGDIVEVRMDPRGRPASGPMNVYAKSKGKPDQAHLDAVKSYDEKQKKKTPEQKKKELDDYRERQMNNK